MNRYNNLNGFRAFCAIGIALMHILANISPTVSSQKLAHN